LAPPIHTYADRDGIARADLDIDIAQGTVKRARAAILRGIAAATPAKPTPTGEEQHVLAGSFLETGRVLELDVLLATVSSFAQRIEQTAEMDAK
jgi:hypothetical protein